MSWMPNYLRSPVWKTFLRMVSRGLNSAPKDRVGVVHQVMKEELEPYLHNEAPERIANTALRLIAFMETHDPHLQERRK